MNVKISRDFRKILLKFLKFNEKASLKIQKSSINTQLLDELNLQYEFYTPPGLDIGASCGQFQEKEYVLQTHRSI